jgi:hypothetical protein
MGFNLLFGEFTVQSAIGNIQMNEVERLLKKMGRQGQGDVES